MFGKSLIVAAGLVSATIAAPAELMSRQAEGSWPMENCIIPSWGLGGYIGSGTGGVEFCATKFQDGVLPNRIKAKADGDAVRGIEIEFTDGDSRTFGVMTGDNEGEINWDPTADEFQSVELWGKGSNGDGGDGDAVSRIVIKLSSGQEMGTSFLFFFSCCPSFTSHERDL